MEKAVVMVFHANEPTFMVCEGFVPNVMQDYHHVATVDTESLDTAYHLTNSIEKGWWENDGVTFYGSKDHGMKGSRSSSVGDVFVEVKDDVYKTFVVVSFGFMDVTEKLS